MNGIRMKSWTGLMIVSIEYVRSAIEGMLSMTISIYVIQKKKEYID
jgi:hypothetical protein